MKRDSLNIKPEKRLVESDEPKPELTRSKKLTTE